MKSVPRTPHLLRALVLCSTLVLAACMAQPDDVADPQSDPTTLATDTQPTPSPEPEPEVNASATLTFPHVIEDSCPGEFCNYGDDRACTTIPVYTNIGDTTDVVATLEREERVEVLTGATVVDQPGIVAVTRPRSRGPYNSDFEKGDIFQPGDTLYVLGYRGEGYYDVWFEGAFIDTDQFWPSPTFGTPAGFEYVGL